MKSLAYRLFGIPRTFGDCLDYALGVKPERVTVRTGRIAFTREWLQVTQYLALIDWQFPDRAVHTEVVLSGNVDQDLRCKTDPAPGARVEACRQLDRSLSRLVGLEVPIDGPDRGNLWHPLPRPIGPRWLTLTAETASASVCAGDTLPARS